MRLNGAMRVALVGTAVVVLVGGGVAAWEATKPVPLWPIRTFSAAAWREASKQNRYAFYNDIIGSKRLDRLTSDEVVALLGEPDGKSLQSHAIQYRIYWRDPAWDAPGGEEYEMFVEFGPDDRVSRVSWNALE